MSNPNDNKGAMVVQPGEGEAVWFLHGRMTVKATAEGTNGAFGLTEVVIPPGFSPPMHVHHREEESFYVLEGELTMWVDGQTIAAPKGSFVYGPRDVPHTFIVSSEEARFVIIAAPAGFDDFVRTIGEPAQQLVIPPPATEPPDIAALSAIAARHGIEILGPPGIPD